MSHIEHITYDRRWHHLFWILKQSFKRHVWIFLKKCENAVSAIQNVIIMPSLPSLRHEMDQPRPQGFSLKKKPWGRGWKWIRIGASVDPGEKLPHERDGDGFRKIGIKFSLIKKINLGVAYALFHPSSKRKVFPPFKYRCFLMKFAEGMKSVINISRAQDKKKSESPTLIEPIWPTVHRSDALTTELRWTCGELGHIQGLCFTCVLRTAKISDFDMY